VTRVLERSDEEGSPLRRALCSGLSAHAVLSCASSLPDLSADVVKTPTGSEQGTTWLAAGCLGDLTTRQREAAQSRIHGRGRAVRMACPRVVMALQKSVGDVLAQRSAGDSLLSRGEAAFAWPGA